MESKVEIFQECGGKAEMTKAGDVELEASKRWQPICCPSPGPSISTPPRGDFEPSIPS